jgi:hypothetical protein
MLVRFYGAASPAPKKFKRFNYSPDCSILAVIATVFAE